jgi:hypothetical protein
MYKFFKKCGKQTLLSSVGCYTRRAAQPSEDTSRHFFQGQRSSEDITWRLFLYDYERVKGTPMYFFLGGGVHGGKFVAI